MRGRGWMRSFVWDAQLVVLDNAVSAHTAKATPGTIWPCSTDSKSSHTTTHTHNQPIANTSSWSSLISVLIVFSNMLHYVDFLFCVFVLLFLVVLMFVVFFSTSIDSIYYILLLFWFIFILTYFHPFILILVVFVIL